MEPKIIERPWGIEKVITETAYYIVREITIKKGKAVSMQYHREKVETLYVLSGSATYWLKKVGEEEFTTKVAKKGDILEHRPYEVHRERALEDFTFIEISTTQAEDIVRLEDDYGRI